MISWTMRAVAGLAIVIAAPAFVIPAADSDESAELIALAEATDGECTYWCQNCLPPLLGHEIEYTLGGANAESSHEEPCNDFGDCEDHRCDGGGSDAEDVQAFLDALEAAGDGALVDVVQAVPERFHVDEAREVLLVRSCNPGEFMARIPLSWEVVKALGV